MEAWWLGLAANAVISVAFLAVAYLLAVNLTRTRQWRHNPLAVGTVVLYITCGGGHVVHTWQLAGILGVAEGVAHAARTEYLDWTPWVADLATAAAATTYWMLRKSFPALVTGTAVFEDLRGRQRRALEIHDNVVQGLVRAKMALDLRQKEETEAAVQESLAASRRIISDLLGGERLKPGAFRVPAPAAKPNPPGGR